MAILNLTHDSFSDGGLFLEPVAALRRAEKFLADGADLIDVGAESTRPGACPVPPEVEQARLTPVVQELLHFGVPISIDTYHPSTMKAMLDLGVDMINDVYGLRQPGAIEAVQHASCALCVMHMQNEPQTMQSAPDYDHVLHEVDHFLASRLAALGHAGIAAERWVVDPGFGFGKKLEHNLYLLQNLQSLGNFRRPILVGLSRKKMLGTLTGAAVEARMPASIAAALCAAERGARIFRVHDVKETVDALKIWNSVHLTCKDERESWHG